MSTDAATAATSPAHAIEQWLLGRNKELDHIDHDADLIDKRYLDSLAFVEFLMFLEEKSGNEIPLDTIDLEDFRTINAIVAKYLPA